MTRAKPANLLALWFGRAQQSARLMCGVSDYDTYVQHMLLTHPGKPVLTYEGFFRQRQEVRYGSSATRCC